MSKLLRTHGHHDNVVVDVMISFVLTLLIITDDSENCGGATALLPMMAMKTAILIMTAFGGENEDNDKGMRHTAI